MIDADGVVHGMGQTPHYTHLLMSHGGSREAHGLKVFVGHSLAAAECHQQPAALDLLHSVLVDAAIAFQSLLQVAVVLGKGRRVEDDKVKTVIHGVEVFQNIGYHTAVPGLIPEIEVDITVTQLYRLL